MSGTHNKL